ncbi:hypothetical protein ABTQ08_22605, partial [Acinetobacter baumannii]
VSTPQSCTTLRTFTLPAAAIGLATRGARVTATETVAASGEGAKAIGAYCKVSGEISPLDPAAPAILFQVDLPAQW